MIIANAVPTIGTVSYWSLREAQVVHNSPIPLPSPSDALRRAASSVASKAKAVAKQLLSGPDKGAWVIARPTSRDTADILASGSIDPQGAAEFRGALADVFRESYETARNTWTDAHLGKFLVSAVSESQGYALRPSGGVYLVPDAAAKAFNDAAAIVEALGSKVYRLPVYSDADGIRVVSSGLREALVAKIAEISEAAATGKQERLLTRLQGECKKLDHMMRAYGQEVEAAVADLRGEVEGLETDLCDALLKVAG